MTPAVELAAALHARFLAMLEAYADDSISSEGELRVSVVAGWFGEADVWRSLEDRWIAILEREHIQEFKASDCHSSQGEFSEWDKPRRIALRQELVGVISETPIHGTTATLTIATRGTQHASYKICLIYALLNLTGFARGFRPQERVAYIVDERMKGSGAGDLEAVRHQLRTTGPSEFRRRVGPAAYDSSAEVIPLQAADLLAHECLLNRLNELHGAPPRMELARMKNRLGPCKSLHIELDDDDPDLQFVDLDQMANDWT